jgi:hypothetical protein
MSACTQAFAQIPGLVLQGQPHPAASGPACAALLVACFLAQAETKSALRLLGVPALLVLAWLLLCVR